jgi:hypothetical protein
MDTQQILSIAAMVVLLLAYFGLAVFASTNWKPVLHWVGGALLLSLTTVFVLKMLPADFSL